MVIIENPAKHQCALFKSSRKHYLNAIEAHIEGRPTSGHLTAAAETAEAGDDMDLYGWLNDFTAQYGADGSINTGLASSIVTRYNEYNAICAWGLEDLDPNDPFGLPGGGAIE